LRSYYKAEERAGKITELLRVWILSEGPNGGMKGLVRNNFPIPFGDKLKKEIIEIRRDYCILFYVCNTFLQNLESIVAKNWSVMLDYEKKNKIQTL